MSTELNLTPEQANVESLLRQLAPVESAVERDALMYQAGWTAASVQPRLTAHWLWPAATATLAAALVLQITLPKNSPPAASPLQRTGTAPADISPPIAKQPAPKLSPKYARTSLVAQRRYSPQAHLLVLRDRALQLDFDVYPSTECVGELPVVKQITNRQLLQEYLPSRNRPSGSRSRHWWNWNLGETS